MISILNVFGALTICRLYACYKALVLFSYGQECTNCSSVLLFRWNRINSSSQTAPKLPIFNCGSEVSDMRQPLRLQSYLIWAARRVNGHLLQDPFSRQSVLFFFHSVRGFLWASSSAIIFRFTQPMAAIYHQGKLTQSRFLSLYKGNLITTKAFSGKSSRMKGHLQRKIKHTKYVYHDQIHEHGRFCYYS